jgi:AcrR family transcriptional regulator
MTVTQPARRTGGRSARVRAAVLRSTLELLVENSADEPSIHDIAVRAGVHETSIYRRWGTRENLILDAVLSEVEMAVPTPDTGSIRGDLIALQHSTAAFVATPIGEALLRLAFRSDPPEDEDEDIRGRFWAERFAACRVVLERAEARGEVRAGLEPRIILESLLGMLCVRLLLTREPIDDAVAEQAVDLILTGIAGQPGA